MARKASNWARFRRRVDGAPRRAEGYRRRAPAISDRRRPSPSTRCGPPRRAAPVGLPPAPGAARRVSEACAARAPRHRRRPAPTTIRLAALRMPSRCAASTASLTSPAAPKSSRGDDRLASQDGVPRRVRRKRKNSTPSRSRRFIISGLTIISADDGCDLGRAEIEFLVEVLDANRRSRCG